MQPVFANLFALENPLTLVIIAGVVVLLFGSNKLAGFGKSAGEGLREFKKALRESDEPAKEEDPKKDEAKVVKSDKE